MQASVSRQAKNLHKRASVQNLQKADRLLQKFLLRSKHWMKAVNGKLALFFRVQIIECYSFYYPIWS